MIQYKPVNKDWTGNLRYIFVSGGVLSSLGKGVTTASLALLLKRRGYRVTIVKCENYLNQDAGLINPIEHGDAFLCEDGLEADMDLGTYEKFLHEDMERVNFVTLGQIYKAVIERERAFGYDGEDVEAVPHVTDEIISRIQSAAKKGKAEIVMIELGGTAGEYQNALYYEASRIISYANPGRVIHVHVSYLPTPAHIGEPKTKPTQLSVRMLNSYAIQPDFIVARASRPLDERRRERFALFCHVPKEHVIDSPNVDNVLTLPLLYADQQFDTKLLKALHLPTRRSDLREWQKLAKRIEAPRKKVARIGIIGKYFSTGEYELRDSYAALLDALEHASIATGTKTNVAWINAEALEKNPNATEELAALDGIIVPIGWGERGVEGKIIGIQYARENKVPYLGLCYGMQLAVVEFARNIVGWKDAHTQEVDPKSSHQVVHIIPEQIRNLESRAYGGTMRLGRWECKLTSDSLTNKIYESDSQHFVNKREHIIAERHRHRYEVNNEYVPALEKAGLRFVGRSVKENLVEFIELPQTEHPFFVATQGHPEYKSRPLAPHPLFVKFLEAGAKNAEPVPEQRESFL